MRTKQFRADRIIFLRQSFLICTLVWEARSPWPSDNLRNEMITVILYKLTIKQYLTQTVPSLTLSVVCLRSGGDEDPGQPHQQSHHQVDGHPRVENLVLRPWWPTEEKGERQVSYPGFRVG